jgi:hypothetical protein
MVAAQGISVATVIAAFILIFGSRHLERDEQAIAAKLASNL